MRRRGYRHGVAPVPGTRRTGPDKANEDPGCLGRKSVSRENSRRDFRSGLYRSRHAQGVRLKLKSRGIVITGASQGLGREIAAACIREGAHVLLCARDAQLLEQTRVELASQASAGQQVLAQPADVSDGE